MHDVGDSSRQRRIPPAPHLARPLRRAGRYFAGLSLFLGAATALAADPWLIYDDNNYWNAEIGLDSGVISAEEAQLFRAYSGALGRLPDAGGFAWWANEIAAGRHDLRSMAAGFIWSAEFRSLADGNGDGTISHAEFVMHMYVTVFGRAPDPGGFNWWLGELDSGRRSPTDVLVDMTQSNEYIALTLDAAAAYLEPRAQLRLAEEAFWRDAVAVVRQDGYRNGRPTTSEMYTRVPDPLNCDAGALSLWARRAALDSLNALRALHQLPAVQYLDYFDSEVQAASLVQLANEAYVGHQPQPGVNCYSQLAYDGASSSNLSYGSVDKNPMLEIFGWADDAFNISTVMAVGHRRHILKPDLGYLAYGATFGNAAQKVFDFGMSADDGGFDRDWVAMPEGAYPYILLSQSMDKPTPWSFHMVAPQAWSAEHDYFSQASVQVVDVATGQSLPVLDRYHDSSRGYGRLHGVLSWIVPEYAYDRRYEVRISGVSLPGGEVREYRYPVYMTRYPILDLDEPLEASDVPLTRGLQGVLDNAGDRDTQRFTLSAPGTLRLIGESRYLNWGFEVELYDARKNLIVSTDEEVEVDLEAGDYTLAVGRCSADGWCYNWDSLAYRIELR